MPDPREDWHLDRRISLGHIVTTLTVAIALVVWMLRLEGAVLVNAERITQNTASVNRIEASASEQYAEIIRRLERLDKRLDDRLK